jgi:RNA polymerase sigma factor (sigma-70 family)
MTAFLEHVLRGAEALAARDPVADLPDADLLGRFAAERDQAAFAVLVRRHGPLVWGVCRNLLARDADAEDAFQATFLALVRGAPTVRRTDALGGWLHGVAYRVAMKARRTAARRKRRETAAAVGEADLPVSDAAWDELQAAVHEEVCRLPDRLRLPFVLCSLQGLSRREAAARVGWTVGTVSVRLSQARRRLLDRLARRGVPAAAVATGVAGSAVGVPASLCAITCRTALAPDRASPAVLSLARGVTLMARTKLIVAGALIAGALTTGLGARVLSTADAQAPPKNPRVPPPAADPADRWEYKFVPMPKALTAGELSRVLGEYGRDRWEYCGAQPLRLGDQAEVHLTFKRPRTADRDAAALEQLEAVRLHRQAADLKPETKEQDLYRKALLEARREYADLLKRSEGLLKKAADEQAAANEAAANEAVARAAAREALTRKAAEADRPAAGGFPEVQLRALAAELQKARQDADQLAKRLAALEADRQKPADPKPAERKAAGMKSVLQIFRLKNASADALAKVLQSAFAESDVRIVPDPASNAILLSGSGEGILTVAKVIEELDRGKD